MTGRERMEAVFRGEMVSRLPRKGEDYSDVLFLLEDPQQVKDGGGYDAFGVYFRKSDDGMTPDPVNTPLHDICDWRTVQFPDPAKLGMEEDAKKVKAGYDPATQMLRLHVPFCHFERMHALIGFENALMAFYDDPEEVVAFFDAMSEYKLREIALIKEYYDPDILCCHDDWGTNLNMFFNPELWREFFKPQVKKLVDGVHALGMRYEQHSCGHVQEIVGDLVELGVDCIQPLQWPCNDIPMIKKTWGDKVVLSGCADTQAILNPTADEATIREKVRQCLETCIPGGRFIPYLNVYGEGNDWKQAIIEDEMCQCEARLLK